MESSVIISEPAPDRGRLVLQFLVGDAGHQGGGTPLARAVCEGIGAVWPGLRLLEARRGLRTVGAIGAHVRCASLAEVIPPRLAADESEGTAAELLARLEQQLAADSVRWVCAHMAVIEDRDPDGGGWLAPDRRVSSWLAQGGYRVVADTLVLVRQVDHIPAHWAHGELTYEPYAASEAARLRALFEATCVGTQDLPLLGDALDSGQLLAAYEATGDSGRTWWRLVRHGCQDVGCLLLSDHPLRQQCEVVYLGLVPAARGRGWGRQMVQKALWLARDLGRQQLFLAVDAANDPAIATYAATGFAELRKERVWLKASGGSLSR
jgi:mycothiol synthase